MFDLLVILIGSICGVIFAIIVEIYKEKQRRKWKYVAVYVHPKTGKSQSIMRKGDKIKCY